jgi:signal peptidase I
MTTFRLLGQPILIAMVLALGVRTAVGIYSIPTSSMEPTLRAGDHIVVTPYHKSIPQRGDVVVFRSPGDPKELLVKRIVAVPGDLVESRQGHLFVSGQESGAADAVVPQVVPANCYFVLGDNRANSFDSREWGVLSRSLLVGHARLVLWASPSAGIDRLFKSID